MIGLRKAEHPGAIALKQFDRLPADSMELARFWISAGEARSYVFIGFQDRWSPELLGSLLVEAVHTAAASYATSNAMSEAEALNRIWRGFDEER
jgi:hypothetical protein